MKESTALLVAAGVVVVALLLFHGKSSSATAYPRPATPGAPTSSSDATTAAWINAGGELAGNIIDRIFTDRSSDA